jgi:putative tricarboxylic transport membrane protein
MQGVLVAATEALGLIINPVSIGFILLGTLIGMVFGALPGLGGTIALALLIPVSFGMEPQNAVVMFGSALGGVAFGGSISAILINVPGTGPNAATLLDGYPMSQQGRAGEALGASATASALGAIFGLIVLTLIIPVAREVILAFGIPEFFWLAVLGLTIIAVVTEGSLLKGLISGGFGLMLAQVGYSRTTGEPRYMLGTEYLWDGINLVVALIGLFALAEIINMVRKGGSIAAEEASPPKRGDVFRGGLAVLKRPSLFFRSAITGTLIGMVPGAGGTVANFVSYMQAMQTSSNPESFGHGNIEGVIASEAANDAKDGGALLPAVVFGIPGSAGIAVLLGGLILHGLNPGRELLGENLPFLFVLIFALLFANIITSVVGLSIADRLAQLTQIPTELLVAPILVVSLVGAFALRNNILDVYVAVIFGFLGYIMMIYDYSRIGLVIALILGPIAERSFLQAQVISDSDVWYWIFFTRPISLTLMVLTVVSLLLPLIRKQFQDGDAVGGGE